MRYLIISRRTDGAVLIAYRLACQASNPSFGLVRQQIERLFPGRAVCSPLDSCAPDADHVTAYISDRADGVGRIASQFSEWAVNPTAKAGV